MRPKGWHCHCSQVGPLFMPYTMCHVLYTIYDMYDIGILMFMWSFGPWFQQEPGCQSQASARGQKSWEAAVSGRRKTRILSYMVHNIYIYIYIYGVYGVYIYIYRVHGM